MRTLGDRLADVLCSVDVAAALARRCFFGRRRRRERLARSVVDDLSVNVIQAAKDRQPRTFGRAAHFLADRRVNALSNICFVFCAISLI